MSPVIGIRREDINEWERRVPLTPTHVKALVQQNIRVLIQPSRIRVFSDEEYAEAGAEVREDLSPCDVVFGIKEIPLPLFEEGRAYMFFSHVIKGQEHNMPMLQRILDAGCTLLDYEKVADDKNSRLLFFGNYAGLAGMLETLHTYGMRLDWEGVKTPMLGLKRPLDYGSLGEARAALEVVGKWIAAEGLPESICPLVVGLAGYGNVSTGAQEILGMLPLEELRPSELAAFMEKGEHSRHQLYKVVFHETDMAVPIDPGQEFDLQDYYEHPETYEGVFAQHLEYLGILVNCIYWDETYPRLVTKEWLRANWTPQSRLKVVGDISCDVDGAIECTSAATDPGNPIYVFLPDRDEIVYGWEGKGPVIMAVYNLPAELPRESSMFFGSLLMPFVPSIANADYSAALDDLDLPPEIKRAVIVHQGKLTPDYEYIAVHLW